MAGTPPWWTTMLLLHVGTTTEEEEDGAQIEGSPVMGGHLPLIPLEIFINKVHHHQDIPHPKITTTCTLPLTMATTGALLPPWPLPLLTTTGSWPLSMTCLPPHYHPTMTQADPMTIVLLVCPRPSSNPPNLLPSQCPSCHHHSSPLPWGDNLQ